VVHPRRDRVLGVRVRTQGPHVRRDRRQTRRASVGRCHGRSRTRRVTIRSGACALSRDGLAANDQADLHRPGFVRHNLAGQLRLASSFLSRASHMPRRTCGALVNWMLAYSTILSRLPRFREFNDSRTVSYKETDTPTFHFRPCGHSRQQRVAGNGPRLRSTLWCQRPTKPIAICSGNSTTRIDARLKARHAARKAAKRSPAARPAGQVRFVTPT
jgi:hypothetical protein